MFNNKKKETSQEPDLMIFTIFDSKSKSYDIPTFAKNKNTLVRDILNMFRDPAQAKNKFLINAEDYSVYKIGEYYKVNGGLWSQELEHVVNLNDLRAMVEPDIAEKVAPVEPGIVAT